VSRPGRPSLAQQAGVRELAVLDDDPWFARWYWRDELEAQQAAARDAHARGGTTHLGDKAHYRPTEQWVPHPTDPEVRGRVWTYQPPAELITKTTAGPTVTPTPPSSAATTPPNATKE